MVATGIPPLHIFMNEMSVQNGVILATVKEMLKPVSDPASDALLRMESMMVSMRNEILAANSRNLSSSSLPSASSSLPPHSTSSSSSTSSSTTFLAPHYATWRYNGKDNYIESDYAFPTLSPLQAAYQLWHEGIPNQRLRPFKFLSNSDVPNKYHQYLTALRKVTAEIERFLPAGYLSMAYGEKDTMFKEAFSKMAASFQIQYPTQKNIAEESFAVQTLYNRYLLKSKRKRNVIAHR